MRRIVLTVVFVLAMLSLCYLGFAWHRVGPYADLDPKFPRLFPYPDTFLLQLNNWYDAKDPAPPGCMKLESEWPRVWHTLSVGMTVSGIVCFACAILMFIGWVRRWRIRGDPLRCSGCSYNLTGNTSGTCPECGTDIEMPPELQRCRVQRVWLLGGIVPTVAGVILMVAFRIVLAANSLRVYDLWNAARPLLRSPKAGATSFAGMGSTLANICSVLAGLTLLYGIVLAVFATVRRDRKALAIAGACVALSVVSGLLALQLGLVIAGV